MGAWVRWLKSTCWRNQDSHPGDHCFFRSDGLWFRLELHPPTCIAFASFEISVSIGAQIGLSKKVSIIIFNNHVSVAFNNCAN